METTQRTATIDTDLFTKMVISNWDIQISRTNKLIDALSEEELQAQVAPDRNRGLYLIGHLAAVHDGMLPLLELGDNIRPEMEAIYVKESDNPGVSQHTLAELKQYWKDVNALLAKHFASTAREEWYEKHAAVSAEDFLKEPHRNKLNIVINRTNHIAYHLGQLIFLKKK